MSEIKSFYLLCFVLFCLFCLGSFFGGGGGHLPSLHDASYGPRCNCASSFPFLVHYLTFSRTAYTTKRAFKGTLTDHEQFPQNTNTLILSLFHEAVLFFLSRFVG